MREDASTYTKMLDCRAAHVAASAELVAAERVFIADVARRWHQGELTWRDAYDAYLAVRANGLPGFSTRWMAALPDLHAARLRYEAERWPDPEDGCWVGRWPLGPGDPRPRLGVSVVYLLFDAADAVAYVGSTHKFSVRLKRHWADGKRWVRWQAYRCGDRADAYAMEQRFLDQHLPYLNRSRVVAAPGPRVGRESVD